MYRRARDEAERNRKSRDERGRISSTSSRVAASSHIRVSNVNKTARCDIATRVPRATDLQLQRGSAPLTRSAESLRRECSYACSTKLPIIQSLDWAPPPSLPCSLGIQCLLPRSFSLRKGEEKVSAELDRLNYRSNADNSHQTHRSTFDLQSQHRLSSSIPPQSRVSTPPSPSPRRWTAAAAHTGACSADSGSLGKAREHKGGVEMSHEHEGAPSGE